MEPPIESKKYEEKELLRFGALERAFFNAMDGVFFNKIEDHPDFVYVKNEILDSSAWNFGAIKSHPENNLEAIISNLESVSQQNNRRSVIYFAPSIHDFAFEEELAGYNYKYHYSDSWMIYHGERPGLEPEAPLDINLVVSRKDMEIFVNLFMAAHGGESSADNPYGGLPLTYREVLLKSFSNPENREKLTYYLGYFEGKPVTYGGLTIKEDTAYLFACGTHPDYRKRGFGSYITKFITKEAFDRGAKTQFLMTETGTANEKLWDSLGYKTEFVAKAFGKKSEQK